MRSVLADSIGQFTKLAAPTAPKAQSHLSAAFPGLLGGTKTKSAATDKPAIAGSDYGMYANVVVNGKVVASLSNSGCCIIADGYGGPGLPEDLNLPGDGPKLAKQRAEIIAKALGGTVETLSTAQTPEQWAKGGKRVGMIDLWGLNGNEPAGYRPTPPPDGLDILLKQQEADA